MLRRLGATSPNAQASDDQLQSKEDDDMTNQVSFLHVIACGHLCKSADQSRLASEVDSGFFEHVDWGSS